MKKTNRILAIILAILIVVSTVPITASAGPDPYSGVYGENLTWSFDEATGTLTISGEGDMDDDVYYYGRPWEDFKDEIMNVVINDGVTSIGFGAFNLCVNVKNITISESVTTIGEWSFSNCDHVAKIVIPEGVTEIGDGAFNHCDYLDTAVIPGSVKVLGDRVFGDCKKLANVTLCEGITDLGLDTFDDCINLTDIVIPNGITSLRGENFAGCTNLKSITIPVTLTGIGYGTFGDCINLQDVYYTGTENQFLKIEPYGNNAPFLAANIHYESSVHTHNYVKVGDVSKTCDVDGYTQYTCVCGHSYKGDYVEALGHSYDDGVVTTKPTCDADGVITFTCTICGEGEFTETIPQTGHSYDDGVVTTEPTCTTEGAKTYTCANCGETYTESVGKVEEHSYELLENTSPESTGCVKNYKCTICGDTYSETVNASGHTPIIIPEFAPTTTKLGLTAGVKCSSCEAMLVAQNIIPAFGTTDDSSVIVSGTCGTNATWTFNTQTGALIISGTGSTTKFKSTQNRPWESYEDDIKTVVVNEGITKIDNYAFKDCNNVMYVSLPDSLTEIGNYVFRYCTNLTSIEIPDNVTSIGSEAFKGCSSLLKITIPDGIYYVNDSIFENCTALTSVVIGKCVDSIENKAFNGCTALTDVYYVGTEAEWNDITIGTSNTPLETATIHFNFSGNNDGEGHEHQIMVESLEPTCTEKGYIRYYCNCGYEYVGSYNALGHNVVEIAPVLPTITTPGHTRLEKCSNCGEVYAGLTIPVLPNEESYAEFQSSDDLIGVTDKVAGTFTIYGTGSIEPDDGFWIEYYIDTVIIADGITGIGYNAFYRWDIVDTLIIGDSVKTIGSDAFRESEFKTIIVGDGVETIGSDAFWASYVETIEMGKNVKSIGTRAFYGCNELKSITIDNENPYITIDEQGVIYNKDKTKLILATDYLGVENYALADTVQTISNYAFYNHSSIESVSLPDTVKTVGKYAFHSCENLETVYYGGTKEKWSSISIAVYNTDLLNAKVYFGNDEIGGSCGDNAIWHLDEATGVFTVSGTGAMFDYSLYVDRPWNEIRDKIKTVVISDGITATGKNAFNDCINLTEVVLPDTVTTIKGFENCDALVSFTIPNSVTTIGDYAFMGCVNLTNIIIPNSVTSIGYEAFYGCRSLTSITIPDTVTNIDYGTFLDCTSLKTAVVGNGANKISGAMFEGCTNLESVTIGNGVKEIYGNAFIGCKNLKVVVLPEGVLSIGDFTFRGCSSLTDITIPKTLTTIGVNAFVGCSMLSDVYYSGTEAEWNQINIKSPAGGYELANATKHFNGFAHSHSYESVVTAPTCTEKGYTTYICACGDSYVADYVDITHSQVKVSGITPTETTPGLSEGSFCSECGTTILEQEIIPALGSSEDNPVIVSDSCGENIKWYFDKSTGTLIISGVGDMYDYTISSVDGSSDHPWADFRDEIKSIVIGDGVTSIGDSAFSDCDYLEEVKFGKNVKTIGGNAFSSCDSLTNFVIPEGVTEIGRYAFYVCKNLTSVTFPSTLTYIGVYAFCECNSLPSVVIPINVESIDSAAFYNCDNLKDVYYEGTEEQMSEILPLFSFTPIFSSAKRHYNSTGADTHPYNPVVTPPTCTEQGYTTYNCACGYSNGVDNYVDAIGHHHKPEVTIPATHLEEGLMTFICACGDTYTGIIEKLEKHNYESVVTAPTCTERGYTTYTCVCGDSYVDDYVDALGHTEEIIPAVAPTCTETGLTEGAKCSVCGETLIEQKELPAKGHTSANAVEENYVAPTCTENGSKDIVVYCSVCEDEIRRETVVINATGHSYITVVKNPTCTEQGYTTYTCDCGDTYVDDYVNATGHADTDGDGYCDADNELLDPTVECDCNCHKSGISKFFFKFMLFFQRMFGSNKTCSCGIAHY